VRKAHPYLVYDRWIRCAARERGQLRQVPGAHGGDAQSIRIIRQAMRRCREALSRSIPGEPVKSFDLVDEAKMGRTAGLVNVRTTVEPTLAGMERPFLDRVMPHDRRGPPSKDDTYSNIEGLMNHFKLIMDYHGIVRPGGHLLRVEAANGELGFYVVSDGKDRLIVCESARLFFQHGRSPQTLEGTGCRYLATFVHQHDRR